MIRWYSLIRERKAASDYFTESGCLSDLGFAHFLCGWVKTDRERRRLEKHLAHCDDCREALAFMIQGSYEVDKPIDEELTPYEATPADIKHYMNLIQSYPQKRTLSQRTGAVVSNIFPLLASPRFAYSMVTVLGLLLVCTLVWMRSTERPHEQFYAQGIERLKSVSPFETPSHLRFIGALVASVRQQSAPQDRSNAVEDALIYFARALGANPKDIRAHIASGQAYLIKKRPEEAQKHFQEALELDRNNPEIMNGLGMAFFERAMIERDLSKRDELLRAALDAFTNVLAADPKRLEALYNQVLASYELGDNKAKVLSRIEKYLALDRESEWAKKLAAIQDKLRLSSYSIFEKEMEDAFKKASVDRLAEMVSASPHAGWLIKRRVRRSLQLEVEGDLGGAQQALDMAEAVEHAYRQSTGDDSFGQFMNFSRELTKEQRQQQFRADHLVDDALDHYQNGDLGESLKLSAAALAIYQDLHNYWDIAYAHHMRGNCYFYHRSSYDQALEAYEAMALAAERARDHELLAKALSNMAVIYQDRGNYYKMKRCLDRTLISAEKIRNTVQQAFTLTHFGNLCREVGDGDRSMDYYNQALILCRRTGDRAGELQNLEHISFLYQRNKEYDKSIGFL